jgi:hypothetical protein
MIITTVLLFDSCTDSGRHGYKITKNGDTIFIFDDPVSCVVQGYQGNSILIGTSNGRIFRKTDSTIKEIRLDKGKVAKSHEIYFINEVGMNSFIIGYRDFFLSLPGQEDKVKLRGEKSYSVYKVVGLSGYWIAGTSNGLYKIDTAGNYDPLFIKPDMGRLAVNSLCPINDSVVLITTELNGLQRINIISGEKDSLFGKEMRNLLKLNDTCILVAGDDRVIRFNPLKNAVIDTVINVKVRSMFYDGNDVFFQSDSSLFVSRIKIKEFKKDSLNPNFGKKAIKNKDLVENFRHQLVVGPTAYYLAMEEGLVAFVRKPIPKGNNGKINKFLKSTETGTLWWLTDENFLLMKSDDHFDKDSLISVDDHLHTKPEIFPGPGNRFLFWNTMNELVSFDPLSNLNKQRILKSNKLGKGQIIFYRTDGSENLYVGTTTRLLFCRFDKDSLIDIPGTKEKNGACDFYATCFSEDEEYVYIGTFNKGLFSLSKKNDSLKQLLSQKYKDLSAIASFGKREIAAILGQKMLYFFTDSLLRDSVNTDHAFKNLISVNSELLLLWKVVGEKCQNFTFYDRSQKIFKQVDSTMLAGQDVRDCFSLKGILYFATSKGLLEATPNILIKRDTNHPSEAILKIIMRFLLIFLLIALFLIIVVVAFIKTFRDQIGSDVEIGSQTDNPIVVCAVDVPGTDVVTNDLSNKQPENKPPPEKKWEEIEKLKMHEGSEEAHSDQLTAKDIVNIITGYKKNEQVLILHLLLGTHKKDSTFNKPLYKIILCQPEGSHYDIGKSLTELHRQAGGNAGPDQPNDLKKAWNYFESDIRIQIKDKQAKKFKIISIRHFPDVIKLFEALNYKDTVDWLEKWKESLK